MTKIKLLLSGLITLGFALISCVFASPSLAAAKLSLDPTSLTPIKNTVFEVKVNIDTDGQSVFGSEFILTYPSSDLTVSEVNSGGFFTDFNTPVKSGGIINVRAYFSAAFESKSGSGTVATIKFTSNKNSGSGNLTFTCSGNGSDTFILNSSGTNILSCSILNTTTINYQSAAPAPGDLNSCGGTCGSNNNCKSDLYCYNGYCRNPSCPTKGDCSCSSATTSPTAASIITTYTKKTKGKTATSSPTTQEVILTNYEELTPAPTEEANLATTEEETSPSTLKRLLIYGGLGLAGLFFLIGLVSLLKKRTKKPPLTPPTTTPVEPVNPNPPTFNDLSSLAGTPPANPGEPPTNLSPQ